MQVHSLQSTLLHSTAELRMLAGHVLEQVLHLLAASLQQLRDADTADSTSSAPAVTALDLDVLAKSLHAMLVGPLSAQAHASIFDIAKAMLPLPCSASRTRDDGRIDLQHAMARPPAWLAGAVLSGSVSADAGWWPHMVFVQDAVRTLGAREPTLVGAALNLLACITAEPALPCCRWHRRAIEALQASSLLATGLRQIVHAQPAPLAAMACHIAASLLASTAHSPPMLHHDLAGWFCSLRVLSSQFSLTMNR